MALVQVSEDRGDNPQTLIRYNPQKIISLHDFVPEGT